MLELVFSLVIVLGVSVVLYPQAASWFSQKAQSRVLEAAQNSLQDPPLDDESYLANHLDLAHQYNDALNSGALVGANSNVPTSESDNASSLNYTDFLNTSGSGFMGRLLYEKLDIDLPIYHGTTDDILQKGVGHLEGTSLPVGGIGTRPVLTAHRGLAASTLFDNLDKAEEGDTFTVSVLKQVLTYQVIDIQIVQPEDSQAVLPDPDKDLVTLVTCTPLGINTHRILVTAERMTPKPVDDVAAATAVPTLPGFPWWAVIWISTIFTVTAFFLRSWYLRKRRDTRNQPALHPTANLEISDFTT